MFVGIIKQTGIISYISDDKFYIGISCNIDCVSQMNLGDSICCNGICLTVVKKDNNMFFVDVSQITIDATTVKNWSVGTKINVETSLRLGDSIDGHMIFGHVDGVGEVINMIDKIDNVAITIKCNKEILSMLAVKGSISLNGISLTINLINLDSFVVNIVPYTLKETNINLLNIKDKVNIEVDMLARYVKRMISCYNE